MREVIDFDRDWLFHRGDIDGGLPAYKGIAYMSAKTERRRIGPAGRFYNDNPDCYAADAEFTRETWERVDLPHDYLIGDVPDKRYNPALGFFRYDNGWYRKKFTLPETDAGRRITLLFEGVATHATVYLNGCLIKRSFGGYVPFEVDLSDYVKFGEPNVLAVYAEASEHEGWWYEGAGIYRHVRLIKTAPVAVDLWGICVRPENMGGTRWRVTAETTVVNALFDDADVRLTGEIIAADGRTVAAAETAGTAKKRDRTALMLCADVSDPALWNPDGPNLYTLRVSVSAGGQKTDESSTRFGFRTFEVHPDKGLIINGKPYKIKGVCAHADCGLTGKAVPDNIHRYKVRLLKEMGANGYRTSHYPQAEALMDALDENGFIVMDETRRFESTEEGKAQLETLIKRDRNRPGVFFWSIGNEEPYFADDAGRRIFESLKAFVRTLDPTRPVTAACDIPDRSVIFGQSDVVGINYNLDKIDAVRKAYPDKPFVLSECCATGTTRGWYFDADRNKAFLPADDHDTGTYFLGRERTWKFIAARPWLLGGYQWTAFEHRGEAVWPRLCSLSGAIDMYLQKKDAFYQNRSHWTETPMVHLLPHWNFRGLEGMPMRIIAYTNCEQLELFVNGVSQGRKTIEPYGHGEWTADYAPGSIEAVGYIGGREAARDRRETTGKPTALKLSLDTPDVTSSGRDTAIFSCYCTDDRGREVPDACPEVTFAATGSGTVYATGSDCTDHTPALCPRRRMYAGRIGVAVKIDDTGRPLTLIASADNLDSAMYTLTFHP